MTENEFKERLREKLDGLPIPDLIAITLVKLHMDIDAHNQFLRAMYFAWAVGLQAIAKDTKPKTPDEAAVKAVTTPARLKDPRIAELPQQLFYRLRQLQQRVEGKKSADDVTREEISSIVKDMKQFNEDIRPVYDWHAEIRQALERTCVEMN